LLEIFSKIEAWGVALGAFIIIFFFIKSFDIEFLEKISGIEAARGLITFLFAISTVGIAVIVVLGAFVGSDPKTDEERKESAERFQRGKDILTILIGVFGAILGFYFGSESQQQGASSAAAPTEVPAPPAPGSGETPG